MPEDIRCPICGSETVERTATKGPNVGQRFHVCNHYPECKGKVAIAMPQIEKEVKNIPITEISKTAEKSLQEKYKLLLQLWAGENVVKTNKLQMLLLANSILISAFVFAPEYNMLIALTGLVFCTIWFFSIGRTLASQKHWKFQLEKISDPEGDNPIRIEMKPSKKKPSEEKSSEKTFKYPWYGRFHSTPIIMVTIVGGIIGWVTVLIFLVFDCIHL